MSGAKGRSFLLKLKQGDSYKTLGGFRERTSSILEGEFTVVADGIFLGSESRLIATAIALSNGTDDFEFSFEGAGEKMRGLFQFVGLDYIGDRFGEATYRINLKSVGEVK